MTKAQLTLVTFSGALLLLMVLGMRREPLSKEKLELGHSDEAHAVVELSADDVLAGAKKQLDSAALLQIAALEARLAAASDDARASEALRNLSSFWNQADNFVAGGIYAEQLAQLTPADSTWAIAGSTYGIGANTAQDPSQKAFAAKRSVQMYEAALELDSANVGYRINKALMLYALSELGLESPMAGILQLRAVADQHPENADAQMHLGRLSMRSGQMDKAVARFEKALQAQGLTDEMRIEAYYMLAEAHRELNDRPQAIVAYEAAIKLASGQTKAALQKTLDEYRKEN
jgi:tetratricopeptide (TPR) repeat protein